MKNRTEQNHYCLLTNNSNFYISQIFKTFEFLSVIFGFAKTLPLRANFTEGVPLALAWQSIMFGLLRSFHSLAMTIKNNLVKTFLTSITFDSLSRKIKNPCLVINILSTGGIQ